MLIACFHETGPMIQSDLTEAEPQPDHPDSFDIIDDIGLR